VKLDAEAVADFGYCFDEFGGIAAVAKRPTERGNAFRQVAFFDHRVRPDLRHQFVFADDTAPGFDQHQQHLKSFGIERRARAPSRSRIFCAGSSR
jgi:hypothetical protein